MWVETRAFTWVLPRVWVQPPQMVLGKFCINHFVPSLADLPGPLQFATRGLYMSADVRVLLFPWLNVMYSSICILFFPLLSLIHFSKCLPRRLNKCLGRWGKVNLGQTASRWTEGWVECVKVNCGPFSLIVSRFLFAPKCDHGLTPNTADASEVRPGFLRYLATGLHDGVWRSWNDECDGKQSM